jgi:hypothetical protein
MRNKPILPSQFLLVPAISDFLSDLHRAINPLAPKKAILTARGQNIFVFKTEDYLTKLNRH